RGCGGRAAGRQARGVQGVDRREEWGQGLARAGRGSDQGVAAGTDRGPSLLLGLRGPGKGPLEPGGDRGMEGRQGHRNIIRRGCRRICDGSGGAHPGLLSGSRPWPRGVGWLLVHLLPRPLMTLRPSLLATALLAATGMASAADASVPTGPLPRTVVPSEVALQLTIDPAQPRFSGH